MNNDFSFIKQCYNKLNTNRINCSSFEPLKPLSKVTIVALAIKNTKKGRNET
jgi:hypothetical protein